jgi:hypothetical protein
MGNFREKFIKMNNGFSDCEIFPSPSGMSSEQQKRKKVLFFSLPEQLNERAKGSREESERNPQL